MYCLPPVKGGFFMPMIHAGKDFPEQRVWVLIYNQHALEKLGNKKAAVRLF